MRYYNANYFGSDLSFHRGGFEVQDGRFYNVGKVFSGIDLKGRYVIPGLLDIHTHGCVGFDFSSCDLDGLRKIAENHLNNGVVAFCPTSMTLPYDVLSKAYKNALLLSKEESCTHARILGINMEGPFLSSEKKGAQNERYLLPPNVDFFNRLQADAQGLIKIVCLAPEVEGADVFIKELKNHIVISAAHTASDYDTSALAFDNGVSHITHLFCAMTPFHHRAPGIIGAAAERDFVSVELIADGIHIHESAIRLAFSLFGAKRILFVSDSMEACGMENGEYQLGGQKVLLKDRRATLEDGTIAGSATPLIECLKNAVCFGISPKDAVTCAAFNPAKRLGLEQEYGSISDSRKADFLVLDEDFNLLQVFSSGICVKNSL